ncbi:hypothetical protein CEP54_016240 [Fusarium duplospermum]|uniref:Dienelactone hydrolase domain-containing protein n=1 Tax=Fusarium duplospermum TaxID=1325734 RepID=A0A428NGM1_9HYPO|nr:hypothetical protein CEP54_016240 [Fusarium duplospermum]
MRKAAPLWLIETFRVMATPGNYMSKLYHIPQLIYGFVPFYFANRLSKTYSIVKTFFEELRRDEGAELKVGAAGFCWGGKHAVLLAGDEVRVNNKPVMDVVFTGHPSLLSIPADIEQIELLVSFAVGDDDMALSVDQCERIKAIVEAKPESQRGEVKIYPGCGHGFCVRADARLEEAAEPANEAEDQCIAWFKKHFGTE